jgi:monofunctional biosynthetic peptidoglycan transglycosylase
MKRFLCAAFAVLLAVTVTLHAQTRELFTFDVANETSQWSALSDAVMGGVSTCAVRMTPLGTLRFTGTISLEHNGGFASIRAGGMNLDLSAYAGLELRIRGDGKRYRLNLVNSTDAHAPGQQAMFSSVKDEWVVVRIPFEKFLPLKAGEQVFQSPPLDLHAIHALGLLIADQQEGAFELEVDWIRPYESQ